MDVLLVTVLLVFHVLISTAPIHSANPCACGGAGYTPVCTESGTTLSLCSAKCYGLKVAYKGRCDTTFFWQAMVDKMDPNGPILTPRKIRLQAKESIWNNLWKLFTTRFPPSTTTTTTTTTPPTTTIKTTTTTSTTTTRPTTTRTTQEPIFMPLVTLNPFAGPRILQSPVIMAPASREVVQSRPINSSQRTSNDVVSNTAPQNQLSTTNAQRNAVAAHPKALTDVERSRMISGLSGQNLMDTLNKLLA